MKEFHLVVNFLNLICCGFQEMISNKFKEPNRVSTPSFLYIPNLYIVLSFLSLPILDVLYELGCLSWYSLQ